MKIAVLMGGISSEREISIRTGTAILNALKEEGFDAFPIVLDKTNMLHSLENEVYDLAFVALHGEFGEDGRIQAVLDILGKKYTGCGFISSAISMDKEFTKKVLMYHGIRVPATYEKIEDIVKFPVVIKPSLEGSSVGLHICNNFEEAQTAVENLKNKKLSIEEFVKGEELSIGVLNGEALGVVKIIPKSGVYDFQSKYTKGATEYQVPAQISEKLYSEAMTISEEIYKVLELKGAVRADMILSEGKLYTLEVNTIPGMTETSLLPKLAALKNYTFRTLVKKIAEDAWGRK